MMWQSLYRKRQAASQCNLLVLWSQTTVRHFCDDWGPLLAQICPYNSSPKTLGWNDGLADCLHVCISSCMISCCLDEYEKWQVRLDHDLMHDRNLSAEIGEKAPILLTLNSFHFPVRWSSLPRVRAASFEMNKKQVLAPLHVPLL